MDEIVELIFNGIKASFKFIIYIVILNIVLFNLGRFTLLGVTLGKYPRVEHLEKDAEKIIWAGFFVLLAIWLAIAIYNNVST